MPVAHSEQAVGRRAVEHAEFFLDQVKLPGLNVLHELIVAEIGSTDRTDFSLLFEFGQAGHRFVDRTGKFGKLLPVHDVDVDVIGLQAAQAHLDFFDEALRPCIAHQAHAVALHHEAAFLDIPAQAALGREDEIAAAPGQRLADDFFAVPEPVGWRGIHEGNAKVAGAMEGTDRLGVIARSPHAVAPDCPGANTHHRCLDRRFSDSHGSHDILLDLAKARIILPDDATGRPFGKHFAPDSKETPCCSDTARK